MMFQKPIVALHGILIMFKLSYYLLKSCPLNTRKYNAPQGYKPGKQNTSLGCALIVYVIAVLVFLLFSTVVVVVVVIEVCIVIVPVRATSSLSATGRT